MKNKRHISEQCDVTLIMVNAVRDFINKTFYFYFIQIDLYGYPSHKGDSGA